MVTNYTYLFIYLVILGQLSKQELIEGYKKTLPEKEAIIMVDNIMEVVDKDNSGFIDYTGN